MSITGQANTENLVEGTCLGEQFDSNANTTESLVIRLPRGSALTSKPNMSWYPMYRDSGSLEAEWAFSQA